MTRMDFITDVMLMTARRSDKSEKEIFFYASRVVDNLIMPLVDKIESMKDLYEFASEFAADLGMKGELEIDTHMDFYGGLLTALEKVDSGAPGWTEVRELIEKWKGV